MTQPRSRVGSRATSRPRRSAHTVYDLTTGAAQGSGLSGTLQACRSRSAMPPTTTSLAARRLRRASLTNEGDKEMLLGHPQSLEYVAPQGAQSRCRVALADSGA